MKQRDLELQQEISRTQHRESTSPGTLTLDRACAACESLGFVEIQVDLQAQAAWRMPGEGATVRVRTMCGLVLDVDDWRWVGIENKNTTIDPEIFW